MRLWPESLPGQLAIVVVAAAIFSQMAAFWILVDERRSALDELRREQVLSRVVSAVDLIAATPPELRARVIEASSTAQTRLWLATEPEVDARERPGRRAWATRWLGRRLEGRVQEIRVAWAGGPGWRPWAQHDDDEWHMPWQDRPRIVLAVSLRLLDGGWLNARTDVPQPPHGPALAAIVSILAMAAAIVLSTFLMVRRITRPLGALAAAAEQLGRGEAVPPLPEAGPAEIGRTTRAFNLMQERLGRFVRDRTAMLAAISHDLRTPITTLRLRAELLDDEEAKAKLLETLDEMQRMVEAALAFTREEASHEETRRTDIAALIESVCADLADLGHAVTVTAAERVVLACRPLALRRAVRNLVENACRYGKRARVAVGRARDEVRITIDDDGPGIPEPELERVFEPFYRLESSRSTETGGIGLGLSIARTIARAHGGDVRLANRAGGGLTGMLVLPEGTPREG